jgi:hypothetical protein
MDTALANGSVFSPDGRTNAEGYFRLDPIPFGSYLLEVRDNRGFGVAAYLDAYGSLTEFGRDTLRPLGSLAGKLSGPTGSRAYVQVYGLNRVVRANDTGGFAIPEIPPGQYRMRAVSGMPGFGFRQPSQVTVKAGLATRVDTLVLDSAAGEEFAQWPYHRIVRVRPVSAGVTETVRDFPLLIRLRGTEIPFEQSDGKDVRFTGPDGKALAYEIERWEASTQSAEIWVRLDSLPGGKDSVDLTMYWGKRDAADFSSGPGVFRSFGAVWHMSEAQWDGDTLTARDASPSGLTAVGPVLAGNRRAVWGYGGLFEGTHYLRVTGAAPIKPAAALTFSAWVLATGTDDNGGEIASMGDNYVLRMQNDGTPRFFTFDDPAWDGTSPPAVKKYRTCTSAGQNILDQLWHHVAGVADGAKMRLYLDGAEIASISFPQKLAYPLGKEFVIGRSGLLDVNHDFTGQIDEVEVSGLARTAAWIKLAYENQKSASKLIEFP